MSGYSAYEEYETRIDSGELSRPEDHEEEHMAVKAAITNELAQAVGTIAKRHPSCSIEIEWREGTPEQEWLVTADSGVDSTVYVVDDETGTHMPLNEDDLALVKSGGSIFEKLPTS